MSKTVRCKFVLHSVTRSLAHTYVDGKSVVSEAQTLSMSPVTTGTPEDKSFWASTPSGKIEFQTVNASAVEHMKLGGKYYIDITEAEE